MALFPDGIQSALCGVTPTNDFFIIAVGLILKKNDFRMRVNVNVADEDIAGAGTLVSVLENDLPIGRFVGIEIGVVHGLVIGVVANDKNLDFTIKVEVGEADVTVGGKTVWRRYGLGHCHGILIRIGSADDVHIVDGVAANQLLLRIVQYIASERHGVIGVVIIAVTVKRCPSVTQAFVAVGRSRTEPFQRGRIKNVAARIHFWITITVEVGERDHAIARSGSVGNIQQSAVDGVGADTLVIAMDEDGTLYGTVGFTITSDDVWPVGKINCILNGE